MESGMQDQFEVIANEAIERAEQVKDAKGKRCSLRDCMYGIREISEIINERANQIREELGE